MWNPRDSQTPKPPAAAPPPAAPPTAIIGRGVIVKGTVVSDEDLTIDGHVDGTIEVGGHRLIIGAGASITADLSAPTITIGGTVNGHVTARDAVDIRATASVDGNVRAPKISVCEGAVLRGRIDTEPRPAADTHERLPIAV